MDSIFNNGTQMCLELWDYGDGINAFTVVPRAEETANNSFSLLPGATLQDDLFNIPADRANPNDAVLIESNPFPPDHTCPPPPEPVPEPTTTNGDAPAPPPKADGARREGVGTLSVAAAVAVVAAATQL